MTYLSGYARPWRECWTLIFASHISTERQNFKNRLNGLYPAWNSRQVSVIKSVIQIELHLNSIFWVNKPFKAFVAPIVVPVSIKAVAVVVCCWGMERGELQHRHRSGWHHRSGCRGKLEGFALMENFSMVTKNVSQKHAKVRSNWKRRTYVRLWEKLL